MPTRAHEFDAGLDLYSAYDDVYIFPRESELFDTGVHIQLPKNTVGFLKSKSGLNVKYGITSEGVIDVGYTGSIMVKLYNHSDKPYRVRKGSCPVCCRSWKWWILWKKPSEEPAGLGARGDNGRHYKAGIFRVAGRISENCVGIQALFNLHCCYRRRWDNEDGVLQRNRARQSCVCGEYLE